jgi:hypothetical protein
MLRKLCDSVVERKLILEIGLSDSLKVVVLWKEFDAVEYCI